ncbi:MAG: hypothetical protein JNJ83_11075 [Verrucomicrobiaceae bacterium]|nr:hypothetical protein [Verrucomicrobiaceae bacterium]
MKWNAVMEHERRINGVLRRAYDDKGWTPVEDKTPAEQLMEQEPEWDEDDEAPSGAYAYPSSEQPDIELRALKMEEALQIADWARRQQAQWIVADGLHPFRIVQRVFAMLFAWHKDILGPFNGAMLAKMLGQGRAAFQATMDALFSAESKRKYGHVVKVGGQKSAESSAAYAANAAKHKPRQQLKGAKDQEREAALSDERRQREAQLKKELPGMWREHERRRLAAEIGCDPSEIDLDRIKPKD